MLNFLLWYLLVTLIGWLAFPLTFRFFPALADRGYSMARALGLLIWGYVFWMMASLGIVENDAGGLFLGFIILTAVAGVVLRNKDRIREITTWMRSHWLTLVSVEILFFLAFAFLAFVRAGNSEIVGTEKPMEMAFINAILRSPSFPPHDPWLSGYGISYYYFGYLMAAMLAKATGTLGSVAFNLMLALVFALAAIGAYGILFNLLRLWQRRRGETVFHARWYSLPLLGPLFLLIVSNLEGFLEVLHSRGVFWHFNTGGSASSGFWKWLDIKDLRDAPSLPLRWVPERYYWWWRASRVVTDYNLDKQWNEIIDEFPFFSFLLGDLHPHVMAIPFGLLVVGMALNLFAGGFEGKSKTRLFPLVIHPTAFILCSLVLGGLAFLNTWDVLFGLLLITGAYLVRQAQKHGWTLERLKDVIVLIIPLVIASFLLYLPFYLSFSSQAGGILPNLENPTRGAQLWVMFGPFFLLIAAYIIHVIRKEHRAFDWLAGLVIATLLVFCLWAFSWLLGWLASIKMPDFVSSYLAGQGFKGFGAYFSAALLRRVQYIGGLATLFFFLSACLSFLFHSKQNVDRPENEEQGEPIPMVVSPEIFIFLLILLGILLVLAPDFVFLRDQFSNRMNTIFKFYYQAWMMLSLAAAFGTCLLLVSLRKTWHFVFRLGLILILVMALTYPVLGLLNKTNSFQIPVFLQALKASRASKVTDEPKKVDMPWTLDGSRFFNRIYPDDMAAASWLRTAPYGVIVEATKADASYTDYGLISIYSGLPTVLGWPMHEGQWRGSYTPQGTRLEDIRAIYESTRWELTKDLLLQYGIRYVVVGTLERTTYHLNEEKFMQHLHPVFQQNLVTIYDFP